MVTKKKRSLASKRVWKHRRPRGKCPLCGKYVWAGGFHTKDGLAHRMCVARQKIVGIRSQLATRGFYKK